MSELHSQIISLARLGLPDSTIAHLVRISPSQLRIWLNLGAAGDAEYLDFYLDYYQALAEKQKELVEILNKDVKSIQYILKHRYSYENPEAWVIPQELIEKWQQEFLDMFVNKVSNSAFEEFKSVVEKLPVNPQSTSLE